MSRTWKNAALGAGVFLLGSLGWLGITGGIREIPQGNTAGQAIQSWTQLGYGILSVTVLVTAFLFRDVARSVRLTWLVVITVSGGMAPVVWGESNIFVGLLGAAFAVLVGWGILKLLDLGMPKGAARDHA